MASFCSNDILSVGDCLSFLCNPSEYKLCLSLGECFGDVIDGISDLYCEVAAGKVEPLDDFINLLPWPGRNVSPKDIPLSYVPVDNGDLLFAELGRSGLWCPVDPNLFV